MAAKIITIRLGSENATERRFAELVAEMPERERSALIKAAVVQHYDGRAQAESVDLVTMRREIMAEARRTVQAEIDRLRGDLQALPVPAAQRKRIDRAVDAASKQVQNTLLDAF
jgi:hypothetical protein